MRPPIQHQPDSEILARVAIQLSIIKWHHLGCPPPSPKYMVLLASGGLPKDGFSMLRFACHSLAAHLAMGQTASEWYRGVAYRAAMGGVFRWHFFAGYKADRNPYPRVTNRGVQTSQPLTLVGHENESDDA